MTAAKSQLSLLLADGRRLGYAEYGADRGAPVLYFHGFPGSRLEAGLADEAARRQGARLIAIDRPGYGLSDDQPGRQLLDWSMDVAALADALALDRFRVLGVSGGAPFALACAARLATRISGVDLVCPLGPLSDPVLYPELPWSMRTGLTFLRRFPGGTRWFGRQVRRLVWFHPEWALRILLIGAAAIDRNVMRHAEIAAVVRVSAREAFARGGLGAAADLAIYGVDWGFPLSGIRLPVRIWHGAADCSVPRVLVSHLATALPCCELRLIPEEGHFSLPLRRMDEILRGREPG